MSESKTQKRNQKIAVIIQSRMTSNRLPGKVLRSVCGKPMLQYLLERLNQCENIAEIVVATSCDPSDEPIVDFCSALNVSCFRGPLLNVAKRFYDLLIEYGFDKFVRISGDSPLLDQNLIDLGIRLFLDGDYDMVTNILPRTFPKGQSVEILKSDVFIEAFEKMTEVDDLEHVTKYIYKNCNNYKILNFESGERLGNIQLSVDTEEDLLKFEQIVEAMEKDHWRYGYKDVLKILESMNRNKYIIQAK